MTTEADIRAFVTATRPVDWYGRCAGLTDRVVAAFTAAPRRYYDSAEVARRASGVLNPDPTACPAGGIHFWYYRGTDSRGVVAEWGHVTIDIRGGGTATLSATGAASEVWGLHAGLISVPAQSARAGMRYAGWSQRFGTAPALTIASPATVGPTTPITPEDDMFEDKDRALLEDIRNKLSFPDNPGYGIPQVVLQRVDEIKERILPEGAPWDQLQLIVSLCTQILAKSDATVDTDELAATLRQGLGEEIARALGRKLAA